MVSICDHKVALNLQRTITIFMPFFIALVLSCVIGALVVLDRNIASSLASTLDIAIAGKNIFKLFPYEITSLLFLFLVSLGIIKRLLVTFYREIAEVFVVSIIIMSQTTALHNLGRLDGFDLITGLFLFALIIRCLARDLPVFISPFDIFSLLLIGTAFFSMSIAGVSQILNIILLIKASIVVFLITNFIIDRRTLYLFIKCFIIVTIISAVIGIFQEIVYLTTGELIIGMVDKLTMSNYFEDTSFGRFLRIPAFTELYKNLSYSLIACATLVTGIIIYRWKEFKIVHRISLSVALGFTYVALFFTFSKDAWLGCLIGTSICVFWRWPSLVFFCIPAMLFCFVAALWTGLFEDVYKGILAYTKFDEGSIRIQLAREGIDVLFYRHPLLGVGINKAAFHTSNVWGWPPHNIFINVAVEMGIMGLVAYTLLIAHALWSSFSLCFSVTSVKDKGICIGLFCGLIGCFFSLQFHGTYVHAFIWILFGIVYAYKRIISFE